MHIDCGDVSLPFVYLVLPIGLKMSRVTIWYKVVERVKERLGCWKVNMFFKVCIIVKSIRARFFWEGNDNERKTSWVKWEKVINSKAKGGLCVGSLYAFNCAQLQKWR